MLDGFGELLPKRGAQQLGITLDFGNAPKRKKKREPLNLSGQRP